MICLISCLKFCIIEPLQKLRARLGTCKTGLSPSVIVLYITVVLSVLCLSVEFLCCLHLLSVFVFFFFFFFFRLPYDSPFNLPVT